MRISKFSPIVRSVGVIGATAALVTGVTFANLTSNTVALSPNNVTVATAVLEIGDGGCNNMNTTSQTGFNVTNFSVSNPATVSFCLRNTGGVPLNITGTVAANVGALEGSTAAQATTLKITCGTDPAISGTLNTSWITTFPSTLAPTGQVQCNAMITLSPSYTAPNGAAIPLFDINFTGTEPTPAS